MNEIFVVTYTSRGFEENSDEILGAGIGSVCSFVYSNAIADIISNQGYTEEEMIEEEDEAGNLTFRATRDGKEEIVKLTKKELDR